MLGFLISLTADIIQTRNQNKIFFNDYEKDYMDLKELDDKVAFTKFFIIPFYMESFKSFMEFSIFESFKIHLSAFKNKHH